MTATCPDQGAITKSTQHRATANERRSHTAERRVTARTRLPQTNRNVLAPVLGVFLGRAGRCCVISAINIGIISEAAIS